MTWIDHGHKVDESLRTSAEVIEDCGLDWKVNKNIVYYHGLGMYEKIMDKYAIVKFSGIVETDCLGVVGSNYVPIQNSQAFNFFDDIVGEGKAIYHSGGELMGGKIVWLLAKLPGAINLQNKDLIEKYLLLVNSHDGTRPLMVMFTPVRFRCGNTLNFAVRKARSAMEGFVSIRHTQNIGMKLEEAKRILGISIETYDYLAEKYDGMAAKTLGDGELRKYLNAVLDVDKAKEDFQGGKWTVRLRKRDRLAELHYGSPGADKFPNSLWNAYNAVTYYADHEKVVKNEVESVDKRSYSLLFGPSAWLKRKAFDVALDFLEE